MAGTLTRTILKRKKTKITAESPADSVFPLRELPYEIQLMIGRECVLRPVPIVVGTPVARQQSDPAEEAEAKTCHNMLQTSKDFRRELYRLYYEENIFELGYYYAQGNFLHHPGRHFVRHVLVDAVKIDAQPVGVPSAIPDSLKLLPALKCLSVRLQVLSLQKVLYNDGLADFIKRSCRIPSVETIQLLVKCGDNSNANDWATNRTEKFVAESLTVEKVWPKGIPSNRTMPQFVIKWDHITVAGKQRYTLRKEDKQNKPGKIMTLVNGMRRFSISSDTATPTQPITDSGGQLSSGYFIAST